MSRIYFHCESGEEAELRGSERAHAGCMVNDIAWSLLGARFNEDRLRPLLPADCFALNHRYDQFASSLVLWLGVGGDGKFILPGGKTIDAFSLALNTALCVGNDQVRLLARLHGQCEIHAYVAGANRAWLAGQIDEGRRTGLFREGQGWEEVAALLRTRDDRPVVTSYSVYEQFPNASAADISQSKWERMSRQRRWEAAFSKPEPFLEMKPDRWAYPDYFFGWQCTTLDLLRYAEDLKGKEKLEAQGGKNAEAE